MVKIRIYFVCEILLLAKAIEPSRVTLCENSEQGYKIITCPENNTISWKSITYGESPCQDANNNRICHSNIDNYFNDHCLGQNNCTLPVGILSNKRCKPPPRRLKVKFKCDIKFWWDKHFGYTDTCANSLAEVKCSSGKIRIEDVISYSNAGRCDELTKDCAKDRLEQLCDDKRFCTQDTTTDSWLFHKRYANIYYYCKSPSDPEVTESILGTSSDHTLDMTTISTSNTITEGDQKDVLVLDDNHRVVIYQHSLNHVNRKLNLCSLGWMTMMLEFSVPAYKEGVTNPSSNKLSSVKSGFPTIEVAVGVPIGIICMICIIVAVVLIRRRCILENSDKKFSNFMRNATEENYLGQQDIALPQYPTNNKVLYSQVQKHDTDTTKNEDGQDCSHQSKDTESPYALSEEGVYDKTNDRRHVVNDTDMYSRTVDTVYDSAEQHLKEERKEETYDHFFEWRTRTGYSSLYAESGDEYNDSKNMTAIIFLIISSVLVMVCGCFCKYTYKRKRKESEPRPVEGMNGMQNTIHQRTEDQPTASESSDEDLGYSENMRGSIIDVRNVPEIGPMSVHGTTFANDNSETINDEQLQDATQNYSHLHLHQLSSWSENIEYHDTYQPPSYEEVSRCDQPR
ncbi:unnamed protein product [Mytilus edulis]|uniref:SUEL-type lectin domain-containing protein n=1 Tax=Mytilus edulis TaxID=6550 RepID=A0A8S3SMF4_MYTED|nr:unnamed protein product [Mytilus edulis]